MSIFRKYDTCRGILLFKWGQLTVELWYCPAGYVIPEHSHLDEDIELVYLMGQSTFYRRQSFGAEEESFKPRWKHFLKSFTIHRGWSHRFDVGLVPLLFLNVARWRSGVKPTSASVDFKLTN